MAAAIVTCVAASMAQSAQPAASNQPAAKAVSPAQEVPELSAVAAAHKDALVDAGVRSIEARSNKHSVHISTSISGIYLRWPKNVKPVSFDLAVGQDGAVTVRASGYTTAKQGEYQDALNALLPKAAAEAKKQKVQAIQPELRGPKP
jgi:hypothetical protein